MLRLMMLALAVVAAAVSLAPARATNSTGVGVQRQWSAMDKCAKLAIQKFPDHTASALAKRDEFIHRCQRDARVPIREGQAPK